MSGLTITPATGATTHEALVPQPNDTYVAELKAFLDGDVSRHASVADGKRVVDIVRAARESAAARREIAV